MNPENLTLNELCSDPSVYDQPCKFGGRCESHAVYCHNFDWADKPMKCRRTWYWGDDAGPEYQDSACPGFVPHPKEAPDGE